MSPRILIVEDDVNILISIEFLLRNAGYAVVASDNGEKAWAALQAEGCDLVVLDVMLPVVNGLELCKRIRATANLQATKILMLSARGRDTEIDAGLKLGADAYMTKPFGTREFLATIAHLLAR
jgi:two-component system alkaline phosphatase synthesis response regulator PhoP